VAEDRNGSVWHTMDPVEAADRLHTDSAEGLRDGDAARRLAEYGPNQIREAARASWWRILLGQFTDFMVLVLIGATAVSFLLGETGDGITILAIVLMNGVLGFLQEYRAERSVETLRQLTAPEARVRRGGQDRTVDTRELVPGDLVLLEAGDRVPADMRFTETWSLEVDESQLTGESTPVAKQADWAGDEAAALADRRNMAYLGSVVTRGHGAGLVVATGMATEMGGIATLMEAAGSESTPLQRRLEHLGRTLVLVSLAIVGVVVGVGVLRGEPLYQMFLTGVSLAVAAIPEGLPAIVTVALALGIQRMIRAHAIVRRLPAVETLGSVTTIASDKTGTLTRNEMTVVNLFADGVHFLRDRQGGFRPETKALPDLMLRTLEIGAAASNARLASEEPGAGPRGHGDPTELALLSAAAASGMPPSLLDDRYRRIGEMPFEAERRRMSVAVRDHNGRESVFVKGAPDAILERAAWVIWQGRLQALDQERREAFFKAQERMAAGALRVLAMAYRPLNPKEKPESWEERLVLVGLAGLMDPPRNEAMEAVLTCRRAGIRPVMITGDHPATARAVAQAVGIIADAEAPILTGRDLDGLDDQALASRVKEVSVFARVSPPHKLRIVRALKQGRQIVAMTGDGVNDAPAVKEADIGVSMGMTGTDVTKEASAMILTDDNFATIVRAVREGRAIYDNIRKFIRYLLSCNVGEVLVMFLATVLGMPLPMIPIQILFVNLVTDGLPALALGVDPPDPAVMERPPRPPGESVFARGLGGRIALRGALIGVMTLLVFAYGLGPAGMGLRGARTIALATLIMSQLFHVFDARSEDRNFLEVGLFSNPWAILAVLSSIVMLLGIIYWPPLARLFYTVRLDPADWLVVVAASGGIQLFSTVRYLIGRERVTAPIPAGDG
jgi:Ca2+-transporting ATPase